MAGGGAARSEWNAALLEDAVAPAYAKLLATAAEALGMAVCMTPALSSIEFKTSLYASYTKWMRACVYSNADWAISYRPNHLSPDRGPAFRNEWKMNLRPSL